MHFPREERAEVRPTLQKSVTAKASGWTCAFTLEFPLPCVVVVVLQHLARASVSSVVRVLVALMGSQQMWPVVGGKLGDASPLPSLILTS